MVRRGLDIGTMSNVRPLCARACHALTICVRARARASAGLTHGCHAALASAEELEGTCVKVWPRFEPVPCRVRQGGVRVRVGFHSCAEGPVAVLDRWVRVRVRVRVRNRVRVRVRNRGSTPVWANRVNMRRSTRITRPRTDLRRGQNETTSAS